MKYFKLLLIFFSALVYSQGCDPKKMNLLGAIKYKPIQVEAKPWVKGKDTKWEAFDACTVGGIDEFVPSSKKKLNNVYGSDISKKFNATGFFRVEKQGKVLVPSTIYWMNQLQGVSDKVDYFVSINPSITLDRSKIIKEIDYEHPLFDVPAMQAQAELHKLNETGPIYYCGSYFKYGFHEDAYKSAVELCELL